MVNKAMNKKESYFDKMTGRKMARLLAAGLVVSVLATVIGVATGTKGVDWSVYVRFVLATLQRLPLLAILTVGITAVLARIQGVESFTEIRDKDESWIAVTIGAGIGSSVLIMWVLLS